MPTIVQADITALLEAIAAADEERVIRETLILLGDEKVPPARIGARVGVAALWGGGDGRGVNVLSVAGRVAEWMRSIPIGPEPDADTRRQLAPALPLTQGFLAVADQVRAGMREPHPQLPEPIFPGDVKHEGGTQGALEDALAKHDTAYAQRILLGFNATGADYRTVLEHLYIALRTRYPEGGAPLVMTVAGARVLEMAGWGDRIPPYAYWLVPLLMDAAPDAPAAAVARAYAAEPSHDLMWLRKRLAPPKEEAAGSQFQRALMAGDGQAACDATLQALRAGATPVGVAAGIALAAADALNAVPQGERAELLRVGRVLQYAHSVHAAMTHMQDPFAWPLLYTTAAAVNALRAQTGAALPAATGGATTALVGGLIPQTMLRTIEQEVGAGQTGAAIASMRRYVQMGHPTRALAGVLGAVAASRDVAPAQSESYETLPLVAAAAEEYLTLPRGLQESGQQTLLTAAIRLASELGASHTLADRTNAAIDELMETRI